MDGDTGNPGKPTSGSENLQESTEDIQHDVIGTHGDTTRAPQHLGTSTIPCA